MTDESALEQGTQEEEKRVGWPELFFDLVFVFAVTGVSALLVDDHGWHGLLRGAIVFVPFYWMWVGTAIQTNLQDAGRASLRLKVFGVALCAIFMAIALPEAYGDLGLLFASAYWAGRLLLGAGMVRGAARGQWPGLNPYSVAMGVTGPLLLVGALLEGTARELVWATAALIDLSSPSVLQSRLRGMHLNAGHLAERFGLFVLIALGESVVAIGASAHVDGHGLDPWVGLAVAAAFTLVCGLWWVYFHFAADAVRHAMATAQVQLDITRRVLSYGHLLFIFAILLIAVGMHDAVAEPTHHLDLSVAVLLFGGTTLYLATFGYTRWAMFRQVSTTRFSAAAVVLALLPVALLLPALAALGLAALVVAALNVLEWRIVARRTT